jgi:putative alpha-1,2-mannosidase
MENNHKEIINKLRKIYEKHRKKYPGNPDSGQMCCMWSTLYPPDIIEDTDPVYDLERAFDISINDDQCIELYDMTLKEAAIKIAEIMQEKC